MFGISAHEALFERPVWELDNLLLQYGHEQKRRREA
jgi:hypothetical protein